MYELGVCCGVPIWSVDPQMRQLTSALQLAIRVKADAPRIYIASGTSGITSNID